MSATAETRGGGRWRGRASSILSSYGGFAPAIVLIGGFFFVPLGIVVAYSFWQDENYTVVHNWTTENYRYFFSVSAYVNTMWATLWVAAVGTAISIGLAFPFAYWLSRYVPRRLRAPLLVLVVVPFWTSYLLRVYSWITILGDKGLLNRFLEWTGITSGPELPRIDRMRSLFVPQNVCRHDRQPAMAEVRFVRELLVGVGRGCLREQGCRRRASLSYCRSQAVQ